MSESWRHDSDVMIISGLHRMNWMDIMGSNAVLLYCIIM